MRVRVSDPYRYGPGRVVRLPSGRLYRVVGVSGDEVEVKRMGLLSRLWHKTSLWRYRLATLLHVNRRRK